MKKIKFTLLAAVMLISYNAAQSQTLHAIIIADTKDARIGAGVQQDFYAMISLCSQIENEVGLKLKEYYYQGDDCNKSNLLNALETKLLCKPEDVVFFYYSGHGARSQDDKSKYPQMRLGASDADHVPLYQVEEIIAKKSPRFRVVIADCCNSYVPGLTPKVADYGKGKVVVKSDPVTVLKTLFGASKGSVIVSSSEAGKTSQDWGIGGAFTICFLSELDKLCETQSTVTWNTLLDNAKTTTFRETSKKAEDGVGHTPIFDVNLGDGNATVPTVVGTPQSDNPFVAALIKMADNGADELSRINMVQTVLKQYFASSKSVVETYSKNGRTMLTRETAQEFLERVSTSYKLINFAIFPAPQTNADGKFTYLKLTEIYKQ